MHHFSDRTHSDRKIIKDEKYINTKFMLLIAKATTSVHLSGKIKN